MTNIELSSLALPTATRKISDGDPFRSTAEKQLEVRFSLP